jgi:hypothetical protein
MKTNKIIKRGADLRVFEFLKDLHNNVNNPNFIGLNSTAKKYKIGTCYGPTLKSLKIIKSISFKKYIWLAGKPTLLMSKKILKHYSENKDKNILENEQVKINFDKPAKRKYNKKEIKFEKQNYSFSILWGLIKIQKS